MLLKFMAKTAITFCHVPDYLTKVFIQCLHTILATKIISFLLLLDLFVLRKYNIVTLILISVPSAMGLLPDT